MSVSIDNRTPFALKVYLVEDDGERFCNLLNGNQAYVQETNDGDRLSVRLLIDDKNEVKSIRGSQAHQSVAIRHTDLRARVRRDADPGAFGIGENILCDLYWVQEDGQWELSDRGVNPNEASFHASGVRPGELAVGTVPGDRSTVLFWAYFYDEGERDPYGEPDDIAYSCHILRNFVRGHVSSNGIHGFEDERISRERLLPTGVPQLFEGEVLVYQSPRYDQQGGENNYFWIFNGDVPDISIYAPPNGGALTARSFVPGPNTVVTVCSEAGYRGSAKEESTRQEDVPIASLKIKESVLADQVGLRLLTDLSEDTDTATGKDVTRFRTTLAFSQPHWEAEGTERRLAWPKVRFQAEEPCDAFLNREASPTRLEPTVWSPYVEANDFGRVQVGQATVDEPPKAKFHCPELFIQTDDMDENHVVAFHPGLALHQRLQDKLQSDGGSIKHNREALGIETDPAKLPHKACDAVQKAILNLSHTAVPNYSQDSRAIHAKHLVNGCRMADRHWHLSIGADGHPGYVKMTKEEHAAKIEEIESRASGGIRDLDQEVEESFFGDIGHFFEHAAKSIAHVVVHVVDEVEHAVQAVVHYVEEGIEKAFKFIVKTVQVIGAMIKKVLDAIKLAVKAIIDFVKFLIEAVKEIIDVYHHLKDAIERRLDEWKEYIEDHLDRETVEAKIGELENLALSGFSQEARAHAHHSTNPLQWVLEKIEWLVHKVTGFLQSLLPGAAGDGAHFLLQLEEAVLESVVSSVSDAAETLVEIAEHPKDSEEKVQELGVNLVKDILGGAKQIAGAGVEFVKENVDALDRHSDDDNWDLPLVSFIKKILGDLTPLNVACGVAAVPMGMMLAARDLHADDLNLSVSSDVAEAHKIMNAVADWLNILTVPNKTITLASGKEPGPIAKFFGWVGIVNTVATLASGLARHKGKDVQYAMLVFGFFLVKNSAKKGGARSAAKAEVVLDLIIAVIKSVQASKESNSKVKAALALEATGLFLELAGLDKSETANAVAVPAQAVVFYIAGAQRAEA